MASAERLGLNADEPESAAAALATLLARIRDAQQDQRRLSETLQAKLGETSRLQQSLGQLEDAVARLLQKGGCADEMEFRRRDEQAGSFRRLCGEAGELVLRIEAATGLSLAGARTAVQERKGFDGLSATLTSVVSRMGDLSSRRSDLSERRGHLLAQLEDWEADEEIHALRQGEEALRLKAAELSQRYAVDRLALALLAEARRGHEKDQQPRIIQLASRMFQELTAGRYHQIYTSVEERGTLFVCDASGRDWPAEQLSRGTREQLFFAFRLAVVEEFGEARCRLPLIVDDVLVNFDPERARRAAQVLARLSSRQQVVAFTCHSRLRDLFASQGGRVVEIGAQERLHSVIGSSVAESASEGQ
jgi:uncharacterized protein YhaN